MGKVKVGGDWAYIDELDGVPLKDDERLSVQWPDGSITVETCAIDKDTFTYNDMGHEGRGPDHKAYLTVSYNGAEARYYLRRSPLLVERVAEGETDESEQLIPGRYEEKVLAEGVLSAPTTRGWMTDAWLTGKPPTVRFVIAELGDDGLMHVRASSDEMNDDGPSAAGKNYLEALDALEKLFSKKLLS